MERSTQEETDPNGDQSELTPDILAPRLWRGLVFQDLEKSEAGQTVSSGVISEGQAEVVEPEREAPSVTPTSLMDTCDPSVSSLSCSSHPHFKLSSSSSSSSSSSVLSLTPPLPPSVELHAVLTDTRLTLDVYQGGASALPLIWGSIPEQLVAIQYLRLSSEDEAGLNGALKVLPHLRDLRSLTIRGTIVLLCDVTCMSP